MNSINVDKDLCTGCHKCIDSCFVDVIRWDDARETPYCAYPVDCQYCFYCERICPEQALELILDWKSKYSPKSISTERR